MPTDDVVQVAVVESERGWGQKIDEIKDFNSREEAEEFVKEFNSHNTSETVPDWYMFAEIME